jgi:hypothetical protein
MKRNFAIFILLLSPIMLNAETCKLVFVGQRYLPELSGHGYNRLCKPGDLQVGERLGDPFCQKVEVQCQIAKTNSFDRLLENDTLTE